MTTTGALLSGAEAKNERKLKCTYCSKGHYSDECQTYRTIDERKGKLKGKCFNCLRGGHSLFACKVHTPCAHCSATKKHHRSLCPRKFRYNKGPSDQNESRGDAACTVSDERTKEVISRLPDADSALVNSDDRGILQTANILVSACKKAPSPEVEACIVLDCGSQCTYVTTAMAKRLEAKPTKWVTLTIYTFVSTEPKRIKTELVKLQMKLMDGGTLEIQAHTVPDIGAIHHPPVNVARFGALFAKMPLATPVEKQTENRTIDLLIGNNFYWDIVTAQKVELAKGLYLIGSKVGWIISGRVDGATFWKNKPCLTMLTEASAAVTAIEPYVEPDQPLQNEVKLEDWWSLESVGIKDTPQDTDDEIALARFNDTIQQIDQRYYVTWPWKDNAEELPTNYKLALGHLKLLLVRFGKDPVLLEKYDEIIQSQIQKGIIEKVQAEDDSMGRRHYLPHHPVITPQKTTTKVRVVYDGSAKVKKDHPSINECLYRGPVILDEVCAMLMRFRLHPVAFIADIEKAFLQVGLQPSERDVTRFFWFKDPKKLMLEDNIQEYRFKRVLFGIVSSPFLLGATVMHHLSKYENSIAKQIAQDIYVDNLVSGAASTAEATEFYKETKRIFEEASMNMREWLSNNVDFMASIPDQDRVAKRTAKVIGIVWDCEKDCLSLANVQLTMMPEQVTKRGILKTIAKFFDPLGLWSPVVLPAKLFLQSLWVDNKDWDDPIGPRGTEKWQQIVQDLMAITADKINRFIGPPPSVASPITCELHCFTDASMKAYGACIFICFMVPSGNSAQLLLAKSRLAPTRGITLPRMELLGVSIGGRLLEYTSKALHLPIAQKFLWTDLQCTLQWICSVKQLSVFVSNRVKKLREMDNVQFRYVPTEQNPADLLSRGSTVEGLHQTHLWWNGPRWLQLDQSHWPYVSGQLCFDADTMAKISSEEKKCVVFDASLLAGDSPDRAALGSSGPVGIDPTRFSNMRKLLRVTAWVLRFCKLLKEGKKEHSAESKRKSLDAQEIAAARMMWVRNIQKGYFAEVLEAMDKGKRNQLQVQLGLWLDEAGILHCRGRLANANLDMDAKHPIVLPKNDWFTKLVIREYHERMFHSGVATPCHKSDTNSGFQRDGCK